MKVSDYILARLADAGIDTAFTVYGGAISELMDAFTRQSRMRYVCAQHEQAAGFMAEGYAKTKGVPGLAIATSGPGGGNLVTAIQNCYYDSTPAIFITGQVSTKLMRPSLRLRQRGFQESPIVDMVSPIVKYAKTLHSAHGVPQTLDLAVYKATEGRPGPVLLDLPIDVQRIDITIGGPRGVVVDEMPDFTEAASTFLAALEHAMRPVILVGGGAGKARSEISIFANTYHIPVLRTWNALSVCCDDDAAYAGTVGTYGGPGRNFAIANADLVLVLGCRLSGRILGGRPELWARGAKVYVVDVDEGLLDPALQERRADVSIQADCLDFMRALLRVGHGVDFAAWRARCHWWCEHYDPVKSEQLASWHHYGFVRRLSEELPADAIVVYDTGGNAIMMGHCFRSKRGQRIFSSNGNTPMGFALAGAIGAWFADPTRPVYCVIGDGGMQLNIQELQTVKHYGVPVKIIILNNHCLGNTKSYQRANGMAEIACGPDGYSCPDFVAIARAYGVKAVTIDKLWGARSSYAAGSLEEELPKVIAHPGPLVVDVVHHDFCDYQPRMVRWDTPIEEMYPYLPRCEFRENMIVEPWKGWEQVLWPIA